MALLKVPVLAAQTDVADARIDYLIRDRLSWMCLLGFGLGELTPDTNTIRMFHEKLNEVDELDAVLTGFDSKVRARAHLAMGRQIADALLVSAPKQHNTAPEKDVT